VEDLAVAAEQRAELVELDLLGVVLAGDRTVSRYICMRVSGERQRNRRKASPENLASAMNEGRPASARISAAHGENAASRAAKLTSEMPFWTSEKVRPTRLSGRLEASRRARVSLS
jgi:hypothetical protein